MPCPAVRPNSRLPVPFDRPVPADNQRSTATPPSAPEGAAHHLTDARRRAWRTLVQVALAAWLATLADHAVVPSDSQAVLLIPLIAWVIAYVQNYLEDRGTIPAILKAPASPGRRPVPRHAAEFESAVMGDGCDP